MSELTSMMNIGKEMARKLTSVGIDSSEKLIEVGAKQAFLKLKRNIPRSAWYICIHWRVRSIIQSLTTFRRIRRRN